MSCIVDSQKSPINLFPSLFIIHSLPGTREHGLKCALTVPRVGNSDGTQDKSIIVDPLVNPSWSGSLVGIAEYDLADANQGETVLIKIETGNRCRLLH